jgi:hypothetical protein
MANHDDNEIGWQVIGTVVMKFFAAFFALISNLQIFAEQMTFATVRASATHPRIIAW